MCYGWNSVSFVFPDPFTGTFLEATGADLGGGVQGVATPPNGQSHSIKCSTTNVLRYAQALIYIAKSLVVVVMVSSKRVVKPLSRQLWCSLRFCTCWSAC